MAYKEAVGWEVHRTQPYLPPGAGALKPLNPEPSTLPGGGSWVIQSRVVALSKVLSIVHT